MVTVSVIIPFYSNVSWLIEAVESVLNQDFKDYEIIVINDGSLEDISNFLEVYGTQIIYEYQQNKGAAAARNRGIDIANGKYIAFLDSDDIWLPQKLSVQVGAMEEHSAIWSYCNYKTFGSCRSVERKMGNMDVTTMQRYYSQYIGTPCVMIRRDYLVKHPECRFYTQLNCGEDSYLWLMINAENKILSIPKVMVLVRIRGNNAGYQAHKQLIARGELWKLRKRSKKELIDNFDISFWFCMASEICVWSMAIITKLENKIKSENIIEFVAKILFFTPWVIFKLDGIVRRRKYE